MEDKIERRLTTILSADVVGYSRLMAADEAATLAQLKAHREDTINPITVAHHGRVVKLMGDGTLMEFGSVVDAVNFAVTFQRAMAECNLSVADNQRHDYRIGINIGDIIVEGDDIYGDGVNVAARLEALAEPGGICVSRTVFNHVKGKVQVGFKDFGAQKVKNIPEPVQTFMVVLEPSNSKHWQVANGTAKQRLRPMALSVTLVVVMALSGGLFWLNPWGVVSPERPQAPTTNNLEAYDYFQRAEKAARTGFRPQLRKALTLYEKAIELDPDYSKAFAADARTAAYVMRNNYDDVLPGPMARKRAYEHASRALEIDPEASLPFSVLAILQVTDGRHNEALKSAERAVALDPGLADAQAALSRVLTFSGRHAEAIVAIEIAMKLNPDLPADDLIYAGLAFLLNDQPKRAIRVLERARTEAPSVDDIHVMLTAAYTIAGMLDAAQTAASEAVHLSPNICVELYRVTLAHFSRKKDLAKILNALAAGGLPRWPYAFNSKSREGLSAIEMKRLAFGRTWQGKVDGEGVALMDMKPNGDLVFRTMSRIATGKAFVSGDLLCERFTASSLNRPMCGPVYTADSSSAETGFAYIYVNGSKVFHFSPIE